MQKQLEGKIKEDKAELDEQRAKLEGRNLREDTRQEIQQIANHVDEIRNDLERKVAEQLAKFNEAKHNLSNFLVAVHAFEEWLNETEAELEACWPLGADLQLLLEKGVYINEVNHKFLYVTYAYTYIGVYVGIYLCMLHTYVCSIISGAPILVLAVLLLPSTKLNLPANTHTTTDSYVVFFTILLIPLAYLCIINNLKTIAINYKIIMWLLIIKAKTCFNTYQ